MKVAVIGSEGFIGHIVSKKLVANGDTVIRISRRLGIDATIKEDIEKVLNKECDYAYLLATKIEPLATTIDAYNYSMKIATTCLPVLVENKIPTIYVSSCEVYGNSTEPFNENTMLPRPINFYSCAKVSIEALVQAFVNKGADMKIARLFTPYGETEIQHGVMKKAIYIWLQALRDKLPLALHDATGIRSWTYETDIAEGLYRMMKAPIGSTINIAGEIATNSVLLNRCLEVTGLSPVKVIAGYPARHSGLYQCVADPTKAEELLNWNYRVGLIEGITKIWKYVNA